MLSSRAAKNLEELERPWRFTPTQTYDADTNPQGLISFGTAENGFRELPIERNHQYTAASACRQTSRLDPAPREPIDPEHIVVADSPTSLGNILGYNLAEPGEAILVSRPIYGRFELDYGVEAGLQIFYADTSMDEAFSPDVVGKYEEALVAASSKGVTIRAVLIVNPHNPVGRCYPAGTLQAIAGFCNKHKLHLISDEVYASSVFDTGDTAVVKFTSILSLGLTEFIDPNLVHVLYGFSKDFASGGLHLGFLATSNEQLRKACRMVLRLHSPSQAAVTIGTAILEDFSFVRNFTYKARQSLAVGYNITTSALEHRGINYAKHGNAGFFIYVDLSPFLPREGSSIQAREFALAQKFVDAGVFLHPGEEHGKDPGWFRLVFSQEPGVLKEGLRRYSDRKVYTSRALPTGLINALAGYLVF
ncbi:Pyridoxal phosphate-dependent transferase major region subdomain 2 [Penicillium chermesinum]|nr:Pyridoxal phosphate-dependent transferase major region subdomain 2 [Penicillium chermesinum]